MRRRGWRILYDVQGVIVADALRAASARVARLDAEVLLAHLLGCGRGALLLRPERAVDAQAFEALVARREMGEPVAYITGVREFWSLALRVTRDVLIPRPDSETLVEAALAYGPRARVLDLGTGSGALLLAVLSEWPEASGLGVDASVAALAVARGNADALGLGGRADFREGDWGEGLDERFGLVLCNPPYVESGAALSVEVGFEPAAALFAGVDGLDAYRRIVPQLPGLLARGGVAVLEIGWTQAGAVLGMAQAVGMWGDIRRDLGARDRVVVLRAKGD
jgi:release factor glutamine methyltransferase